MINLEPCPYCGPNEKYAPYFRHPHEHYSTWVVACGYCESRTCDFDTQEQAAEHWNRRPDPVKRVHPDQADSTLNTALPAYTDLTALARSLYSAAFDYGDAAGKPGPNPHYQRVMNAHGRLRYAFHVLLGTEPEDESELAVINRARRDDGRPEIKVKGRSRAV